MYLKIIFQMMVQARVRMMINRDSSKLICRDSCAITTTTRMTTTIEIREQ